MRSMRKLRKNTIASGARTMTHISGDPNRVWPSWV
jgi:hypothetical protein